MQATVANQDPQATFYVPLKEYIRTGNLSKVCNSNRSP